jgi:DNA-binding CsgD family transcriptional regulator
MVKGWGYASAPLRWAPTSSDLTMPKLTAREFDILGSIARGHTIRQTARTLGIAAKTVENTQARLFRKLGVRNRIEALTIADTLGLVDRATLPVDERSADGQAAGLSLGSRQPALDPARARHQQDRCGASPRQAQPGIDVRVPVRASLEIARTGIPDDYGAVWVGAQAADDDAEGGKRIRAAQGLRNRGIVSENQPAYPHQEMIIAAD